jgi:hypothetical protein
MRNALTKTRLILLAVCAVFLIFLSHGTAAAQEQQQQQQQQQESAADDYDGSRQLKYDGFAKRRPAAPGKSNTATPSNRVDSGVWNVTPKSKPVATPAPAPTAARVPSNRTTGRQTRRHVTHTAVTPTPPPPRASGGEVAEIGVTIWRLRPGKLSDDAPVMTFMNADGLEQIVTPVRIKGTDPVTLGDRLRFSIESPRTGYLYVINRTQYEDGSIGVPELIFPTLRTRSGDNRVMAGRLIDLPAQEDSTNFFTLDERGAAGRKATGEILDIIVSPSPIAELSSIGRNPLPLQPEQVAKWSQSWGHLAEQLEQVGGEGQPMTAAEKEAGASGGRSLTQEEPQPQTIYRVRTNAGGQAMVTVQLVYGKTKVTKK